MKKIVNLIVFMAMSGMASAGDMENAAASADLSNLDVSAVPEIAAPAPVPVAPASVKEWVEAVKGTYLVAFEGKTLDKFPAAAVSELPKSVLSQLIKDLKVKGSSLSLKRGKTFKNIRLTSKSEEIECREGKTTIVLKTCFLKKV